jgi:hypothetical protein
MKKKKRKATLDDLRRGRAKLKNSTEDTLDPNNVMPRQCETCPWRPDRGILRGQPKQAMLGLIEQVLTIANQPCHSPGLVGKPENQICRGARDFQLLAYFAMGELTAPTDEAWREALERRHEK